MPDAATYTHGHPASVLRSHTWRTAENSAAFLLPHLKEDQVLLDVGCGPGTITVDLARRLPAGSVIGADSAPEVLELARAAASEAGVTNATFQVEDIMDLSLPDGSVDVVYCHQVLQHLADPVGALRELRRVCRPGGLVAARDGDFGAMTWYPAEPGLDRWRELYSAVARANGGEPDAGRHLRSWAIAAGYTEVVTSGSAWCYATDAERSWWSELWADRITATRLAERAIELGVADRAELEAAAAAWHRWAAHPDAVFLVPNTEVLCRP